MKKENFNSHILILLFLSAILLLNLNITLPEAQYKLALTLYTKGRFHSAIVEFKRLLKEYPEKRPYVANSYYWIGQSYFNLKKYKKAIYYLIIL